MKEMHRVKYCWPLYWCVLVLLLSACTAGLSAFNNGEQALGSGQYDEAVTLFLRAVEKNPERQMYRMKLQYARGKAALEHKIRGDHYIDQQNYLQALEEYQLAIDLDGSLYAAVEGAGLAGRYLQAQKLTADGENLFAARRKLQAKDSAQKALQQIADYPPALQLMQKLDGFPSTIIDGVELEVASTEPITLNFNDAKLPDVFTILTKLSGINFILDEDVRSTTTSLFLEKATFAQALELLLRMNKLDKKVLNSKTIILFPKSRDKQKQFEDQLIQTFYLSNIDAKKAVNLLRTMLQVRKIYVNEELNAIILRDNPEVVKLAQKILEANDRNSSEVVFDLELIEVNHNDTRELGLKLSNYSAGIGLGIPGSGVIASSGLKAGDSVVGLINGINGFNNLDPFYAIPTATFRLMKTQVDAEVLANPKIRVRNKEKAKVHIGSKEPVVTVTINGDQTSENVQYVDVGVKLDVEPQIQLDNSIMTKLGLEVSNVSGRERTSNGTAVLTISTTNTNTVLTLKDGEQTIIGGLIRDDKSATKNKVAFLGDIPLLGELFNGTDKNHSKREILLSITPHIVKSMTLPEGDVASIWSGGEDDLKFGRNFGSFVDDYLAGQQGVLPAQTEQSRLPVVEKPELRPETTSAVVSDPPGTPSETSDVIPTTPKTKDKMTTGQAPLTNAPPPSSQPVEMIAQEVISPEQQASVAHAPRVFAQGAQQLKVGDILETSIRVSEIEGLFSAPMYVQYDPKLFEFLGATEGDFLNQDGTQTVFTHTSLDGNGMVIVGLKQGVKGQGSSGDGELFRLQFKAIAPGSGEIKPSRSNFRNPQGDRLRVESTGLKVEIKE